MNELHFVTDPRKSVKEWVSVCRKAGEWLDWIHLRKPGASTAELQDWGLTLIREVGVDPKRLTVNGNVEVAENLGCGGVHLPERHPVDTIFTGEGTGGGLDVLFTPVILRERRNSRERITCFSDMYLQVIPNRAGSRGESGNSGR